MSLKREMHQRIEKALAGWNNYEVEHGRTRKGHNKIVIWGPTGRATVFYPSTPSDLRGIYNATAQIRRAMHEIGADPID